MSAREGHLAGLGFDYLILDMEHSGLDLARARETICVARTCGVAPLVRVSEVHYHLVSRALDAGAEGIVLPRVERPEQCRDLVRFARFAPDGERGLSTFAGHNNFTPVADVREFVAERNRNILLFVQIETRIGLERNLIRTLPVRTPDDTARWQATGMNMVTLSTDGGLLAAGARQFLASVSRPALGQNAAGGAPAK